MISEFRVEHAIHKLKSIGCSLKTDSHTCDADECNQALSNTSLDPLLMTTKLALGTLVPVMKRGETNHTT